MTADMVPPARPRQVLPSPSSRLPPQVLPRSIGVENLFRKGIPETFIAMEFATYAGRMNQTTCMTLGIDMLHNITER